MEEKEENSRVWNKIQPSFTLTMKSPYPVQQKNSVRFLAKQNVDGTVNVPVICVRIFNRPQPSGFGDLSDKLQEIFNKVKL